MSRAWDFSAGDDAGLGVDFPPPHRQPSQSSQPNWGFSGGEVSQPPSIASQHPLVIESALSSADQDLLYSQGLRHFKNKNYASAHECWLKASKAGHPAALCDLGWLLGTSHLGDASRELAFRYALASAMRGYSRAQNNVGLYYRTGAGCQPNAREAVKWLEAAKAAGYPKVATKTLEEAKAELASIPKSSRPAGSSSLDPQELYENGLRCFTNQDISQALDLWEQAADQNHPVALCDLGWLVGGGYGKVVPKDPVRGFNLTKASAELGFSRAANNLGLYYFKGTGCKEDVALAVHWLEVAEKARYKKLAKKTLRDARVKLETQQDVAKAQILGEYRKKIIECHDSHLAQVEYLKEQFNIEDSVHDQIVEEAGIAEKKMKDDVVTAEPVADGPRAGDCVICMDKPAEWCLLWCMHLCLCEECAKNSYLARGPRARDKGRGVCPTCRAPVKKVKRVYFA